MAFNDEMDRYMREKRRSRTFSYVDSRSHSGPSWWDKIWSPQPKELPRENLMPDEQVKLEAMEHDMAKGEERLRTAPPTQEPMLEEEQENRVTFYHKLKNLFSKEQKLEDAYEDLHADTTIQVGPDVTDDFRTLATIQMRWLERMPTRVKDEFRNSDDYGKYVEILQRRGVARKK